MSQRAVQPIWHGLVSKVALLSFAILLSSCAITLISGYDEQTDKSVTALQRKFETFFVMLEGLQTPLECGYDKNKTFYDESKVDISVIQVRAAAIPLNGITNEQVGLLSTNLGLLETLHKGKGNKKCFSPDELKPLRQAFLSSFTAILKLELAKKRGDSK